jgi:hypothetical protein
MEGAPNRQVICGADPGVVHIPVPYVTCITLGLAEMTHNLGYVCIGAPLACALTLEFAQQCIRLIILTFLTEGCPITERSLHATGERQKEGSLHLGGCSPLAFLGHAVWSVFASLDEGLFLFIFRSSSTLTRRILKSCLVASARD